MAVSAVILLCLCVSCASTQKQPADTGSKITGKTSVEGKGIPYGTSESGARYKKLAIVSDDPTYAFTEENPVKVGGGALGDGPANERKYLNALRGPNGEVIEYERQGSCCFFETGGDPFGGLLDMYSVTYEGLEEPVTIYINMYDPGVQMVPVGFTAR